MLLKKITLENFRQFKGIQSVDFSDDSDKNVTIILGENGAGKTTFAQAFRWCLYGKTTFSDPILLNKEISQNLGYNKEAFVRVSLRLIHSGTKYEITREQKYTTNSSAELKANSSELKISFKDSTGKQKFVDAKEVDLRIKEILPFDLSNYFFFDGERIKNMSEEINTGKSEEFKNAVERLLGLSAFTVTLNHLNGRSPSTVIKSYTKDFDSSADSKIAEYQKSINELDVGLQKIDERNSEIDSDISKLQEDQKKLSAQIEANKETENLAKEKSKIEELVSKTINDKSIAVSELLKSFNEKALSWISKKLIFDCVKELSETNIIDKGIPDITASTIEFLKKRGVCICGTCLKENSKELEKLNELLNFIPPKSLGTFIAEFVENAKQRLHDSNEFYSETFSQKYKQIREKIQELEKFEEEISKIEQQLRNTTSSADLQNQLDSCKNEIKKLQDEKIELAEKRGSAETDRKRNQSELDKHALKDKNNQRIAVYKAYATYMYNLLKDDYEKKEKEVREKLQENINEIFKQIYNGKLSLQIDEKYNIKVTLDEFTGYTGKIETSTAQSMSVIFAFIAGVIKMARENARNKTGDITLQSEPYPLVMDAPLSNFDKERVTNVCETLPKIAEQVIFFSFDKDAEVAEANMSSKIGRKYEFIKINELETKIEVR